MEKLIELAKIFIDSLMIIFTKDITKNKEINYDSEYYTMYNVTIINPRNNKCIECKSLIDNIFISKTGKIGLFIQYNFLMEILLDYLYKIDDNSYIRDKFSEVFGKQEIKLLIEYFKQFPNFKKVNMEYEESS